jgi:hypothetical protein
VLTKTTGARLGDTIATDIHGLAPNIEVPYDQWVTLGFLHDGLTTIELSIDGVTVARTKPRWPVRPEFGATIGNAGYVEFPLVGDVDEVKIWRLDPYRIPRDFFDRPKDDATVRCWLEFLRWWRRWRKTNPECADEMDELVATLTHTLSTQLASSPMWPDRFLAVKRGYHELWQHNRMGGEEMATLLNEFAGELKKNGVDPDRDQLLNRLLDSNCFHRFRAEMPSLDCDPELATLLRRGHPPRGPGIERA